MVLRKDDDGPQSRTIRARCAAAQADDRKNEVSPGAPRPKKKKKAGAAGLTAFALNYGRPGFPLVTVHAVGPRAPRYRWLVSPDTVDYETYVPVLADGLRDRPSPYGRCAALALWDLLARDDVRGGDRVLSVVPRIVFPLRRALDVGSRDWTAVVRALLTLQRLAAVGRDNRVGRALVPYYRQLLRPIDRYYGCGRGADVNVTDGLTVNVTYNVRDLCAETLVALECRGGPCAYANIKYEIPTYESTAATGGIACCPADEQDQEPRADVVNV